MKSLIATILAAVMLISAIVIVLHVAEEAINVRVGRPTNIQTLAKGKYHSLTAEEAAQAGLQIVQNESGTYQLVQSELPGNRFPVKFKKEHRNDGQIQEVK